MSEHGLTQTNTILDKIMARKQQEIEAAQAALPARELRARLVDASPVVPFVPALHRETVALIAEVKKASPSKGVFVADFDPPAIAREYAAHGAAAISVLTDTPFFQGHLDHLRQVKAAVDLPVLRKEFILSPYQVLEARAAGADAVLLIAACLSDGLLRELYEAVQAHGMAALLEVHNEAELARVLPLEPALVGINNRNLHDFSVDLATTVQLAAQCPADITLVGESGIHNTADVRRLAEAGVHAVLVGESLMRAADRPAQVQALSEVAR